MLFTVFLLKKKEKKEKKEKKANYELLSHDLTEI